MTVQVLQKVCIQCGLCPSICPEVFTLPDTGESAYAISGEIPVTQQAAAQEAADSCPVSAIEVR